MTQVVGVSVTGSVPALILSIVLKLLIVAGIAAAVVWLFRRCGKKAVTAVLAQKEARPLKVVQNFGTETVCQYILHFEIDGKDREFVVSVQQFDFVEEKISYKIVFKGDQLMELKNME